MKNTVNHMFLVGTFLIGSGVFAADLSVKHGLMSVNVTKATFVSLGKDSGGQYHYQVVADGKFDSECMAPASDDELAFALTVSSYQDVSLFQLTDRLRTCPIPSGAVIRSIAVQSISSNSPVSVTPIKTVNGISVR